jgi:hypothetical protein
MVKYSPHLSLAHGYWKALLRAGDIAIDATCGNGHDTAILAQLLLPNPNSLLYGLDVQQSALDKTSLLIRQSIPESHTARVSLYQRCHSEIDRIPLPFPPRLIVYNLGYLPGGDKSITTLTGTTLQSLQKAIFLLAPGGAISVTCYPGHPEGKKEEIAILNWAELLPHAKWQVCHHRWINRSSSPSLLWIRSIESEPLGEDRGALECPKNASHRS